MIGESGFPPACAGYTETSIPTEKSEGPRMSELRAYMVAIT
ncbi:unnamed protein product [marine sediment metagenome]|uniref:Uncharacterized protein n=1 Tax=marine sediment metagenome TaxID=412755 RepID=X0YMF3_9ZZZZ